MKKNESEQTRGHQRQPRDRGGDILDLNHLPSMHELLGGAQTKASANNSGRDSRPEKSRKTAGSPAPPARNLWHPRPASNLELGGMPSMQELLESRPGQSVKHDAGETDRAVTSPAPGQNAATERGTVTDHAAQKRRKARRLPVSVIIDGSNVCRSVSGRGGEEGGDVSSLGLLLKLTLFLVEHGVAFRCVFDASERFALGRNSQWPQGAAVYRTLLGYAPDCFSEVPAGQSADETILKWATDCGCPVVSNDRFDKSRDRHQDKYPWIAVACKRLIRSETDCHGMIFWPELGLHARPGGNPQKLAEELLARL